MHSLKVKGSPEEVRAFLATPNVTWDDLEDLLIDIKGAEQVFERIDLEKKRGHVQKALATTSSLGFILSEIRRKITSHYRSV